MKQLGFGEDSISMVTRSGEPVSGESAVITDAEIGATAGGIGGALLGVVVAAVPGVGPVMALGPLLTALGGAGLGAVAGGLVGALTESGLPRKEADYYAESIRRGDAVVTVRTVDRSSAERAVETMDAMGAVDIDARLENSRPEEFTGHQPGLEPFSEDERTRARGGWPHNNPRDIGESLVDVGTPDEPTRRRSRIY